MDVPTYLRDWGPESQSNYNEELNQNLQTSIGNDGFEIPQFTNAQLTTDPYILPDGTISTVALSKPDGTLWYVTDASPPCYVGKISGALVKFTTTAYP